MGRMGQAIMRSIAAQDDLQLAAVWVRDVEHAADLQIETATLVSDDLANVVAAVDVLIDFSLPDATDTVLAAVSAANKPLVIGVSGLSDQHLQSIDSAAKTVPIVYDRNMSIGVAVLENLVRTAAAALGPDFSVEIQETHHVHKIDSPSGTALKLGDAIAAVRGTDAADIHYEVERRGEVPGDHTVALKSETETVTLGHSVTTRQVFADGAVRAARWVVRQQAGRYTMQDVLG